MPGGGGVCTELPEVGMILLLNQNLIISSTNYVVLYSAAQQKSRFFSKLACRLVFNCR